jgi:hypothetical protein
MKNRIAFALLMGIVTTGAISFALIYLNVGFGSTFVKAWLSSWGLGYVLVIPIMLVIGPKLQRLIARLFTAATDTGSLAPGVNTLPQRIAFALLMGAITTGVISFAIILANLGFREDFAWLWVRAWGSGYLVVVPMILAMAPLVQRLVDRAFAPVAH